MAKRSLGDRNFLAPLWALGLLMYILLLTEMFFCGTWLCLARVEPLPGNLKLRNVLRDGFRTQANCTSSDRIPFYFESCYWKCIISGLSDVVGRETDRVHAWNNQKLLTLWGRSWQCGIVVRGMDYGVRRLGSFHGYLLEVISSECFNFSDS
jgi:hypothetical protein